MKNLIPSKDVREYLASINYELTDFQKATLIWNTHYDSLDEQLNAIMKIAIFTDSMDLREQIGERILFEKDSIKKFQETTSDCIYVVYDEDDSDTGHFTHYDTARQFCVDNGYKNIQKRLLIKDTNIPQVRPNGRWNPYISPELNIEIEKYDGQSLGSITFNDKYEIRRIWSNEMPIKREKQVDSFNPDRFESAYTEIPFSLSNFKEGTIVHDLRSDRYGVISTTTEEWEKYMECVHNGLQVDFIDYSLTVYFICESGRWTHDHIHPIYLVSEPPSENESSEFRAALASMSRYMSETPNTPENEQAVIESSLNYARSLRKEYTTIDEIIFC